MSTVYVFVDETGNFDFSHGPGASKYFGVGSIMLREDQPAALAADLSQLRRELAWKGHGLDSAFHATEDKQPVRDAVFGVIAKHSFVFDMTLLEKSKAQPHLRATDHTFYRYAWYYHFKRLALRELYRGDSLFVAASAIGTKKARATFRTAINGVLLQCVSHRVPHVLAFWPNGSDHCLQVADYCTWAMSRKWERGDLRSYDLISSKVRSEYDLFASGTVHYY